MRVSRYVTMVAVAVAAATSSLPVYGQETATEKFNYVPHIHGAMRARWEGELDADRSRFQLRNARVTLDGGIAPTIDYFLQVDLCDQGTMKFLDGWARIKVTKGLAFQAGQFRMPFGVDPFKAPANYIFANRSFIGKQVCNVRAVGAKATYTFDKIPLTLEGGVFNPTSINDHTGWNSSYAYAGRAIYRAGSFKFDAGVQSLRPDGIRINLYDGCINWTSGRWILEGEYMYKHYTNETHAATHAYNVWGDYHMPIKAGAFNRLSFQGRFDGMTAHSSGKRNSDGVLTTNDPARNRVTVGATISYVKKPVWLDIRADYEKYFYHHGVDPVLGQGDRLVLEMVLRF
ncbi:MAG: OprO/OprP family phosphate-selective porin [Muribaculaceae bacterium]|nr:OprO/OprP family phosphate-selective porin [Muribaculaceae bacterium]